MKQDSITNFDTEDVKRLSDILGSYKLRQFVHDNFSDGYAEVFDNFVQSITSRYEESEFAITVSEHT
jgi:hypothetical protein